MLGHTSDTGKGQLGYSDFTLLGKIKIKHELGSETDGTIQVVWQFQSSTHSLYDS